jgi:hypothetical protein
MERGSLVLLIFIAGSLLPLQQNVRRNARLITTFERGDYIHAADEAAIGLTAFADQPGDIIAVRICSKEPLPLALAIASGRPFYLTTVLADKYHYSRENILFLRSENCARHNLRIAITEYWAVPYGAPLPSSVESIKSSQVKAEEYAPLGSQSKEIAFKQSLQNLAKRVHTDPGVVGVIVGYYLRKPNLSLRRKLWRARSFLEESGLPKNRYFIRQLPWTGTIDSTDLEPTYPAIIIIDGVK